MNGRSFSKPRKYLALYQMEDIVGRQPLFAAIIVGQDSSTKEGCASILRSANFRILDSVLCAGGLLDKVHPDPSLVLFVHTGNEFGSVVEQIRRLKNSYADARIAILADRAAEFVSALRAGASGYFVKGIRSDVFIRSLELMMGEARTSVDTAPPPSPAIAKHAKRMKSARK